jgi:prevent-host-death family protein
MKIVTAAEANRQFSAVLRDVAGGASVLVTSRGKPVATIEPARAPAAGASPAKRRLLEHLHGVRAAGRRDWNRDELYR